MKDDGCAIHFDDDERVEWAMASPLDGVPEE